MFNIGNSASQDGRVLLQDPPIARFLLQSSAASWLWLILRLLVGYQFLTTASWGEFSGGKWLDASGSSIPGYWQNAVNILETGKPPITNNWYSGFLQFMIDTHGAPWFSYVIVFGEPPWGWASSWAPSSAWRPHADVFGRRRSRGHAETSILPSGHRAPLVNARASLSIL